MPIIPKEAAAQLRTKIAIYAISFTALIYMVPLVAMARMVAAFPGVPQSVLMLTLSLPCLVAIFAILAIPYLRRSISIKKLSVISMILLIICGVLTLVFHENLTVILISSALQGLGNGTLMTAYSLLTAEHFSGDEKRRVMGASTGMVQLGRMLALYIAGYLADVAWYRIYYVFGLYLLGIALVVPLLPDDGVVQKPTYAAGTNRFAALKNRRLWYLAAIGCVFLAIYGASTSYASLYIESYRLGQPSTTGTLSSAAGAVAVAACFLSARIRRMTGRYTSAVAFVLVGVTYIFAGLHISLAAVTAALIGASFSKAQQMPELVVSGGEVSDVSQRAVCTAIVLTGINLGQFLSPMFASGLASLFGGGSPASVFLIVGMAALILGCCIIPYEYIRKRRAQDNTESVPTLQ